MNGQDLKNSILQLAIQGKLVEQRQEEGTAKELLEQIRSEKKRMVKEGKVRRENPLPEITEDEIPFDIPEGWKWVRLGEIVIIKGGKRLPVGKQLTKSKTDHIYIRVTDMKNQTIDDTDLHYIDDDIFEKMSNYIIESSDIYIVIVGSTIGKVGLVPQKFHGMNLTENAARLIPICIDRDFLMRYLSSMVAQKQYIDQTKQVGQPKLALIRLAKSIIPLPPLEEQKRIVAKIEELLPYVDQYDDAHAKVEEFNKKFPEEMQKSILQYAIKGKLVEQRQDEGTAEDLYQQIQAGKIKREKSLPVIAEEEIPFDIPESWKWVRLGDVIDLLSGQDFPPEKYNDFNKGIPYITGASSLSNTGVTVSRWTEEARCIANAGDVLLVCKGSGYGKTVICDVEEAHIARQIMSIRNSRYLNMMYVKYFMEANHALIKQWGQGVIPGIDRKSILIMLIPLPPLDEQKRIVAKIEELLPFTKQLVK